MTNYLLQETGDDLFLEIEQKIILDRNPHYVASSANINGDTTDPAEIAPEVPTHQADDILIACAVGQLGGDITTATAGWAEIGEYDGADTQETWWWIRASAPGTTGPTFTCASGDVYTACHVFRGCVATGTPYEDATVTGNNTAETTPDSSLITTTDTNRLAVCMLNREGSGAFTSGCPPAGWTKHYELASTAGTDGGFAVISKFQAAADNVAAVVIGTWGNNYSWGSLTLALLPEA